MLVLDGDPEFFAITKRLHNALHGSLTGGQGAGLSEHKHYEQVLQQNLVDLAAIGDGIVIEIERFDELP